MPLIKVQTSIDAPAKPDVEVMLKKLSKTLADRLSKPESYVMTAFEPNVAMTFGGTLEPTCYVEVKSVGTMAPEQTKAMSKDFCQLLAKSLNVSENRIYIEFADAKGYLWGWNGSTF
jgi:phenylpyruvate tautomerase